MKRILILVCIYLQFININSYVIVNADKPQITFVTRDEWGARDPTEIKPLKNPVPYVIIHHTYQPPACNTTKDCIEAMKWIQDLHQNTNHWSDIGYNFCVGGDNKVYIARGWSTIGRHALTYNDKSVGICIIGDWRDVLPPSYQLDTVKALIELGVEQKKIADNYILYGHRQVRDTECPGDALFKEISTWEHFSPKPSITAI